MKAIIFRKLQYRYTQVEVKIQARVILKQTIVIETANCNTVTAIEIHQNLLPINIKTPIELLRTLILASDETTSHLTVIMVLNFSKFKYSHSVYLDFISRTPTIPIVGLNIFIGITSFQVFDYIVLMDLLLP
jgi:hypothetical protein